MSKLKKKKLLITFGIIAAILIGIVVCLFLLKEDKQMDNKNEEEKEVVEEKKLKILDLDSDSRPYAVMINNNSAVWKYQSGLMDAYMVYEMLVEGGITREMALFKDADTEKIASVRSSRHYFLDYALENDAIYVHWGYSPQAISDIKTLGINNIDGLSYEGTYFFRDNSIKASLEHRGYTKMESLKKATAKLGYRDTTSSDPLLGYSVDSLDLSNVEGVKDAKYVAIKFSGGYTAKFIYDEENKVYKRKQNNTDMVDYTSKENFTAKNIITYEVGYSLISGDSSGKLNMSNIGSGSGYFITEGKAIPIKWEKSKRSGKTKYTLENGEELVVNDGNTYIELQPKGQTLTIDAEIPA